MNILSKMSGKLQGIAAINTSPFQNKFCMRKMDSTSICSYCYSQRMLQSLRKNANPKFIQTGEYLSSHILSKYEIPFINTAIVRINAHGEFINSIHVKNILNIVKHNPHAVFAIWTKRKELVKDIVWPSNVIMVYSTPQINVLNLNVPKGFHKVFSVYTKKFANDNNVNINCHGKCIECRLCYTHNDVVYINELLK